MVIVALTILLQTFPFAVVTHSLVVPFQKFDFFIRELLPELAQVHIKDMYSAVAALTFYAWPLGCGTW